MSEPTTAGEVMQRCLRHWDLMKNQVIPRCCLTGWEADLLVIRPSGWAEEVEIKVSKSDFRAEWTKKAEKHENLRLGGCRTVGLDYGSGEVYWMEQAQHDPRVFRREHRLLIRDQATLIRKFWFAMPRSLAEELLPEVPAEYGVLAVGTFNRVLREPTALRLARKFTEAERIRALHSAYYRFWSMTLYNRPDGELRDFLETIATGAALDMPAAALEGVTL